MSTKLANWFFDEGYWKKVIGRPEWYSEFVPYSKEVYESLGEGTEEIGEFRKTVRHFFEKALQENRVALADHGPNLDAQREPIDTIVIHHTSAKPGYRLSYMEATQLLNVYAPYYFNPTLKEEYDLKGKAIWSNHFRNSRQTFLCYHWLMRKDGSFERLLDDEQIGWHAGNWDINKRSVAICIDDDYEKKNPTDKILRQVVVHIKNNYPGIKASSVIGHCEASQGIICPGSHFLDAWKPKLLGYLH